MEVDENFLGQQPVQGGAGMLYGYNNNASEPMEAVTTGDDIEMAECYNVQSGCISRVEDLAEVQTTNQRSGADSNFQRPNKNPLSSSAPEPMFSPHAKQHKNILRVADSSLMDSKFNTSLEHIDRIGCRSEITRHKHIVLQRLHRKLKNSLSVLKQATTSTKPTPPQHSALSSEDVDDMWRELAFGELLKIVDIPMLSGLLKEIKNIKKCNRQFTLPKSVKCVHANSDFFINKAVECVSYFTKIVPVIEKQIRGLEINATKLHLFRVIKDHYKTSSRLLLPEGFAEIHSSVLQLVLEQNDDKAVKVLQLEILMLPWTVRNELQRLLSFMVAATTDDIVSLANDINETNESVILNAFTDTIIKQDCWTTGVSTILTTLMMSNVDILFQQPEELQEIISSKIQSMKSGEIATPVPETTFCYRVSHQEYDKQATDCTKNALAQMVFGILDDSKLTFEQKKHMLQEFRKYHPITYEEYGFPSVFS